MEFNLSTAFIDQLPSDDVLDNHRRQVVEATHSYVTPKKPSNPKVVHVSDDMLDALGLTPKDAKTQEFLDVFSGKKVHPNTKPYAMAYAGHQFGNWAGQLGDGRAINLFEVLHKKQRWVVQLKGAGETPYSRQGDGLAVLRSSIREYLCSEAMHHLGVPTTRALSLVLTGEDVLRDVMYNGNAAYEKGAVLTRMAPSFIRFGNFELFAARKDHKNLKILTDYAIRHFYSDLGKPSKETYIEFFRAVTSKTLEMVIHWQRVGFVHGVMNTDNMSILGLTIDYGPYGWLEGFDFGWTPNTTDAQNKRYRFGNQPNIALWNLMQLANALYPLIKETNPLETILEEFSTQFEKHSLEMMRSKLGLINHEKEDQKLIEQLEDCLVLTETDMTIFFRTLSLCNKDETEKAFEIISNSFYKPEEITEAEKDQWKDWFKNYGERLKKESSSDIERKKAMDKVNPKYVLRNYMAQMAIDAADNGDYNLINELYTILKKPYDEQPKFEKWFAKRPEWARHKVGCSMLSCSS